MTRLPECPVAFRPPPTPSATLARVIAELADAGVNPTPLAILGRCTDLGLSDAEIEGVVEKLSVATGGNVGALHG